MSDASGAEDGLVTGARAGAALRDYLLRHRIPFQLVEDPPGPAAAVTVAERLSGKSLRFAWGQVLAVEHAKNLETGSPYVRVSLDDGRRFAFAAAGIVFAPSFGATGPIADCPTAGCFADYARLLRHAEHLVEERHADEHGREALQVVMVLLAFLEGARLVGFDVAEEEREVEPLLEVLELRRAGG